MSGGQQDEFDHPYKLLTLNDGDDSITNTEGAFSKMLKATGDETAKSLFEIAKESYMRN